MYDRVTRCPDCAEGVLHGNGRCSQCDGTGINPRLVSDEPKCPAFLGTGVCPKCGGVGIYPPQDDGKTQTLFG